MFWAMPASHLAGSQTMDDDTQVGSGGDATLKGQFNIWGKLAIVVATLPFDLLFNDSWRQTVSIKQYFYPLLFLSIFQAFCWAARFRMLLWISRTFYDFLEANDDVQRMLFKFDWIRVILRLNAKSWV